MESYDEAYAMIEEWEGLYRQQKRK